MLIKYILHMLRIKREIKNKYCIHYMFRIISAKFTKIKYEIVWVENLCY